jgi:hypothetical protein
VSRQKPNLQYVTESVLDLLQNTSSNARYPTNVKFLANLFPRPMNIEGFLCHSALYERARIDDDVPPASRTEHQLAAKLHCLYGVPIEYPKRTRSRAIYPYATSKVYDLRQYTDKTLWGPFLDDGSQYVDWEKVEAIMVVLGHNLQIFSDRTNGIFETIWTHPFAGATPNSYRSPPLPSPQNPLDSACLEDPYNVTGTWMRVSGSDFALFGYKLTSL